jgi:hypothetical protein
MGYSSTLTSDLDGTQILLKWKAWWGPRGDLNILKKRKIFVPTRIRIPDYPAGGIGAILTTLFQPGDFHPGQGHEGSAMGTVTHGKKHCTHRTGGGVVPRASCYTSIMKTVE